MKRLSYLLTLVAIATFSGGCKQSADSSAKSTGQHADGHGHAHDDDSHDHGDDEHAHGEPGDDHSTEGHSHGTGPHGGTVADWGGGKYHVEFTVDHELQQATVYVLGSDEQTPEPIDAQSIELSILDPEMQVTLNASPQDGDANGKSSRFVGTHEKLSTVQEYAGTMTGVVDGTPYSGDFQEQADEHFVD